MDHVQVHGGAAVPLRLEVLVLDTAFDAAGQIHRRAQLRHTDAEVWATGVRIWDNMVDKIARDKLALPIEVV